jgi:DnaK suppressor protein
MSTSPIIRHQLLARRDELIAHYHDAIEIADGELDHRELEEGAAASQHWEERVISLLAGPDVLHELAEVLAALSRIDAGTFGQCLACGCPIDSEILEADPATRCCGDCEITGEINTSVEYRA